MAGATLAEEMADLFARVPILARYSEAISVAIVALATTCLSLVIGKLVPRRLAMSNPVQIAWAVAPAVRTLSRLASPVVRLLSFSTDLLIRLLGTKERGEAPVSEEEIRLLLQQGPAGLATGFNTCYNAGSPERPEILNGGKGPCCAYVCV